MGKPSFKIVHLFSRGKFVQFLWKVIETKSKQFTELNELEKEFQRLREREKELNKIIKKENYEYKLYIEDLKKNRKDLSEYYEEEDNLLMHNIFLSHELRSYCNKVGLNSHLTKEDLIPQIIKFNKERIQKEQKENLGFKSKTKKNEEKKEDKDNVMEEDEEEEIEEETIDGEEAEKQLKIIRLQKKKLFKELQKKRKTLGKQRKKLFFPVFDTKREKIVKTNIFLKLIDQHKKLNQQNLKEIEEELFPPGINKKKGFPKHFISFLENIGDSLIQFFKKEYEPCISLFLTIQLEEVSHWFYIQLFKEKPKIIQDKIKSLKQERQPHEKVILSRIFRRHDYDYDISLLNLEKKKDYIFGRNKEKTKYLKLSFSSVLAIVGYLPKGKSFLDGFGLTNKHFRLISIYSIKKITITSTNIEFIPVLILNNCRIAKIVISKEMKEEGKKLLLRYAFEKMNMLDNLEIISHITKKNYEPIEDLLSILKHEKIHRHQTRSLSIKTLKISGIYELSTTYNISIIEKFFPTLENLHGIFNLQSIDKFYFLKTKKFRVDGEMQKVDWKIDPYTTREISVHCNKYVLFNLELFKILRVLQLISVKKNHLKELQYILPSLEHLEHLKLDFVLKNSFVELSFFSFLKQMKHLKHFVYGENYVLYHLKKEGGKIIMDFCQEKIDFFKSLKRIHVCMFDNRGRRKYQEISGEKWMGDREEGLVKEFCKLNSIKVVENPRITKKTFLGLKGITFHLKSHSNFNNKFEKPPFHDFVHHLEETIQP